MTGARCGRGTHSAENTSARSRVGSPSRQVASRPFATRKSSLAIQLWTENVGGLQQSCTLAGSPMSVRRATRRRSQHVIKFCLDCARKPVGIVRSRRHRTEYRYQEILSTGKGLRAVGPMGHDRRCLVAILLGKRAAGSGGRQSERLGGGGRQRSPRSTQRPRSKSKRLARFCDRAEKDAKPSGGTRAKAYSTYGSVMGCQQQRNTQE